MAMPVSWRPRLRPGRLRTRARQKRDLWPGHLPGTLFDAARRDRRGHGYAPRPQPRLRLDARIRRLRLFAHFAGMAFASGFCNTVLLAYGTASLAHALERLDDRKRVGHVFLERGLKAAVKARKAVHRARRGHITPLAALLQAGRAHRQGRKNLRPDAQCCAGTIQ